MEQRLSRSLAIRYQSPNALVPNPSNARTHSKKQIQRVATSIKKFGFNTSIAVDGHNNVIYGHARLAAAKQLGLTEVPTVRLDHLSPDDIRAYLIADNRLAELAGWDKSILKIELEHLLTVDEFDITLTGFDIPEVDLVLGPDDAKQDLLDDCAVNENAVVVTQASDLWLLGKHRLYCGNALKELHFQALMGRAKAHMVFTDPPYNVPIAGHASGKGRIRHREFPMASGEMTSRQFCGFLKKTCAGLARHSHDGSIHYICMDWRHQFELLSAAKAVYSELKNLCVWVKDNGGMGSFYRSQHELVYVFKNGKRTHLNNVQLGRFGRNRTNVWNYPGINSQVRQGEEGNLLALHPTVKPISLVADAILDCTARGHIVLDPFLGSGSTLMAAERVARDCYGMELDPLYVDTAIRRWQRYTGNHAVHAVTGKKFDDCALAMEALHG